jgi:hypothetical protein
MTTLRSAPDDTNVRPLGQQIGLDEWRLPPPPSDEDDGR